MMPSPRLFRSRWAALLWAAGIVWFAVDVASSAPPARPVANASMAASGDDADAMPDAADIAAVANLIDG